MVTGMNEETFPFIALLTFHCMEFVGSYKPKHQFMKFKFVCVPDFTCPAKMSAITELGDYLSF